MNASHFTHVAKLWWDAKYIFICMAAWFTISAAIGRATVEGELPTLETGSSSETKKQWLAPVLYPSITYRRDEIRDPKLLLLTLGVFVRNAWACALTLFLGSCFIFVPPLFIFANGWLIGALLHQGGYQSLLRRMIPHGFIELPVMLSTASIATLLAFRFYREIKSRNSKLGFLGLLRQASFTYVACLPLLFVEAVLEGYGTRLLWG